MNPIINLPKTTLIKDPEEIKKLDLKLAGAIIKIGNNPQIQIDELAISGVEFIFSDNNLYSLFLKYHKKDRTEKGELTIEKLVAFVHENQIDLNSQLNSILVYIYNEHGRDRTAELKSFLDFVDDERHCLIDGRWHKFNESYLKYLNSEVDKLDIITNENYNSKDDPDEDYFNRAREKDGFIRLDKILDTIDRKYRLEKLDLLKDDTIFFVKRGVLQKISYVVDQSLITVKLLQNKEISLDSIGCPKAK